VFAVKVETVTDRYDLTRYRLYVLWSGERRWSLIGGFFDPLEEWEWEAWMFKLLLLDSGSEIPVLGR
jgi:hypothetical protein